MDRQQVTNWVAAYERAWRTPGTRTLGSIFTESANYLQSPYAEPIVGLAAIAEMWEAEREQPTEIFDLTSSIVAVDGDTAVVRVDVSYRSPTSQEFRDLWIIRFAEDGRCFAFEEWPFAPREPATAAGD
jgi:hypothetical protein